MRAWKRPSNRARGNAAVFHVQSSVKPIARLSRDRVICDLLIFFSEDSVRQQRGGLFKQVVCYRFYGSWFRAATLESFAQTFQPALLKRRITAGVGLISPFPPPLSLSVCRYYRNSLF